MPSVDLSPANLLLLSVAAAVTLLLLAAIAELRSTHRLRRLFERDMARIFEQLDQVQLDSLRRAEPPRAPPAATPGAAPASQAHSILAWVRSGVSARELARRCGMSLTEAEVTIALHAEGTHP